MESELEGEKTWHRDYRCFITKKPCYDIVFQQSFDGLWEELEELGAAEKKLCIVTDSTVDELYGAQVLRTFGRKMP